MIIIKLMQNTNYPICVHHHSLLFIYSQSFFWKKSCDEKDGGYFHIYVVYVNNINCNWKENYSYFPFNFQDVFIICE